MGLNNPGCSNPPPLTLVCYLNSVLQQIFMIPTFRRGLLAAEDKNLLKEGKEAVDLEDNLLY